MIISKRSIFWPSLLLPVILITLSSVIAVKVDPHVYLSPVQTSASSIPLTSSDLLKVTLSSSFVGIIFLFLFQGAFSIRQHTLWRYFSILALSAAAHFFTACFMFYSGYTPCDPNIYILSVIANSLLLIFAIFIFWRKTPLWNFKGILEKKALPSVIISSTLAGFFGILLVGTAVAYKKNVIFAEKLNLIQGWFSSSSTDYGFLDQLDGERFLQLIDFDYDEDSDTYFLLERWGRIYSLRNGVKTEIVNFSDTVGVKPEGEHGSYSIELHKDYGSGTRRLFVFSTVRGKQDNYNALWELNLDLVDSARCWEERRTILKISTKAKSHNSGALTYDHKGLLLVGIGELSEGRKCQEPDKYFHGTILRIDPDKIGGEKSFAPKTSPEGGIERDYFIPHDNPFVGDSSALDEVWAFGMRNPFRIDWSENLNAVIVGDVGQWTWEELNLVKAGENHGWPSWEADESYKPVQPSHKDREGFSFPFHSYVHTARDRSVLGGEYYTSDTFPDLNNLIIFGDNCSGKLWSISPDDGTEVTLLAEAPNFNQTGMTRLRVTQSGEILVAVMGAIAQADGSIYRLVKGGGVAQMTSIPKAETSSGPAIYNTHCALCHGPEGRGDGMVAKESNMQMPDFTHSTWPSSVERGYVEKIIREGGASTGKNAIMPAWKMVISEKGVQTVTDYLYQLSEKKPEAQLPE